MWLDRQDLLHARLSAFPFQSRPIRPGQLQRLVLWRGRLALVSASAVNGVEARHIFPAACFSGDHSCLRPHLGLAHRACVAVTEPGVQSVAYMIHERAWRFGARRYPWLARG